MRLPVLQGAGDSDSAIAPHPLEELRSQLAGEIRLDRHNRLLYATDASIYQVEPIGVVIPASIDDVVRTVEFCAERGLPILPRGGGTSLAGQAVNHAVIIDFSAHCDQLLHIDESMRTVEVEAGIVLAHLNQQLAPYGLMFGPDVATAAHANLGGMIGNNSAGAYSVRYGRTVDNLLALDVMLAGGKRFRFDEGASERDPEIATLTRAVFDIIDPIAEQIDRAYPKNLRHVDGYNLDLLLAQRRASTPGTFDRVNLAHLFCGAEGTLGVTLGATLSLVPVPKERELAILAFPDVDAALEAVNAILETEPAAVELVDDVVINLALQNPECRRYVELMPRDSDPDAMLGAVLYVEYFAETRDALDDRIAALERTCQNRPLRRYPDAEERARAWKLRASGEPLLHGLRGRRKPLTFIEDAAVDPKHLPEFIRRFRAIIEMYGTTAAYYAHASVGCLHVRPMIDPRDPPDLHAMQRIAEEVTDLVKSFGGALSGEHGDGRLRSHLLERFYGKPICDAFRRIKAIFDPDHRMNPGNLVEPASMTEHLRVKPDRSAAEIPPVETFFRYDRENGFDHAVEMCNGAGVCRKMQGGTMCPSYRATRDERHATRGRGNALRLAISGQLSREAGPGWNDAETHRTLDLCLSCKACKSECPSNVDLAKLKAEYLAQADRQRGGADLARLLFGRVRQINALGSALAPLSNFLAGFSISRYMAQRALNVDSRRSLPGFDRSLFRWVRKRAASERSSAPTVLLFGDCFTAYNEPAIGRSAIALLENLGYRVILPDLGCCGRSMISLGLLPEAIRTINGTISRLQTVLEREKPIAILTLEPSCHSALIDDWCDLKLAHDPAEVRNLAQRVFSVEDFVIAHGENHPRPLALGANETGSNGKTSHRREVIFHGHCHQKALHGTDATVGLLQSQLGDSFVPLDAGCCGMAGAFGYTRDHYELSRDIANLALVPALRDHAEATILAPGTSCRHQIRDLTGRTAMHPVEWIEKLSRD
ncbi:MAG: FAD-binding oxidoreductase [Phycisphaerales bacterium]|nr:MAG: FAD-binding oxidoreductase [Phycisphaerales bacterium]